MQNVIGIDVGGTHISLAQIDPDDREHKPLMLTRIPVDAFGTRGEILRKWLNAINDISEGLDRTKLLIGIAMPGPFDYEKGIALMLHGKFIDMYNMNIKESLAVRLRISPGQIYFINDAAAFLQGEVYAGVAKGYDRVFGMTLGTGLGTTFYKNGEIATDEDLWDSPFRETICEDYVATRWFVKKYKEITGEPIEGVKELLDKSKGIQEEIFDEYAETLGEIILKYVKYYDPQLLVLGGSISKAFPLYGPQLRDFLEKNDIEMEIKISTIFETAPILGAASYILEKVGYKNAE